MKHLGILVIAMALAGCATGKRAHGQGEDRILASSDDTFTYPDWTFERVRYIEGTLG